MRTATYYSSAWISPFHNLPWYWRSFTNTTYKISYICKCIHDSVGIIIKLSQNERSSADSWVARDAGPPGGGGSNDLPGQRQDTGPGILWSVHRWTRPTGEPPTCGVNQDSTGFYCVRCRTRTQVTLFDLICDWLRFRGPTWHASYNCYAPIKTKHVTAMRRVAGQRCYF